MTAFKTIAAAAVAACALTAQAGPADAQEFMSLHLTGVQVVQEGPIGSDDTAFAIAYVIDESGRISPPRFMPGNNTPWVGLDRGDILHLDERVWHGPVQTVQLQAHVYEFDTRAQDTVALVAGASSAFAGALVAVGTGGAGALGGAAIGMAGQLAAERLAEAVGPDQVPLGQVNMTLELDRVGAMADRPQSEHQGIYYDFYTEHSWNGALYGLFWEVRR